MRQSHRSGGAVVVASAILLLTACSAAQSPPEGRQDGPSAPVRKAAGRAAVADPATVQANELGAVPVLMYHQLVAEPKSVYDRTPQDFRAELERLAGERYVPVTAREFSSGKMDIPAGTHPVVLTFDDSTVSQFRLGTDGRPAPDTAVGILLDTARKHPGFRPVATFFVNADPFSEPGGRKSLDWLAKHEFEVGNHTLRHTALGTVDDDTAQKAIADNQKAITQAVPGLSVVSLALPNGSMSRSRQLALKGAADGVSYQHEGVYLVGADPAPSPFSTTFDRGAIPRIRSQAATGPEAQFTSTAWLDKLRDGTVKRYTSDGDPKKISFPKSEEARLAPAHRQAARPY
ncbi:polysaccharide deacetylase family protein [Streptomyces sp. WM6378]|uniref:polysaccharide deacetylase family protein n=1 Tax=Streptomyces sp. WM6378 TaxID=1415557 RepID=UPI0006ADB970|nr:polysaccharide deacetylase family protein [Streptomyces sp. WM6378]KOU41858.1 xylanase [Streptomyces sp. WM6378]